MQIGMKREDRYVASHRPYLLAPASLRSEQARGSEYVRSEVNALWFRKKGGVLNVSFGTLSTGFNGLFPTFEQFVEGFRYGRYGGTSEAQWDGERLWTPRPVSENERRIFLDVLEPALLFFPEILPAWQGWYDIREDLK